MNRRLDYNLRHIASNVSKGMNTLSTIHRIFDTNDLVGLEPLALCDNLYNNLREIQRSVSIMMSCNNGVMDDFKYKEGDLVWYYDNEKKYVIPTRIVAVLRNTDHYYMLQYDPFTLRHEDNLFPSEQELMKHLEYKNETNNP